MPPGRVSEPGRAGFSRPAGTCPAFRGFRAAWPPGKAVAVPDPATGKGRRERPGGKSALSRPQPAAQTHPRRAGRRGRGGWHVRGPGASGRVQDWNGDPDGGTRTGRGREAEPGWGTGWPRASSAGRGWPARPRGPGSTPAARGRPAARQHPPCASPPLVSTPMALPAPDVRSFSRSTVAMAPPTPPSSLSRPAPPLSPGPPRALRPAPAPCEVTGVHAGGAAGAERGAGPTCLRHRPRSQARTPGTCAAGLRLLPTVPASSATFLNLLRLTSGERLGRGCRSQLVAKLVKHGGQTRGKSGRPECVPLPSAACLAPRRNLSFWAPICCNFVPYT